ncbi:hypothetical protein M885DRAFT_625878 [Pelagophyceae sp. CCMP2097]|nr:hypothetical protein M885DRAFT_625878 [Pelagophyceae sp. CCMP2097]
MSCLGAPACSGFPAGPAPGALPGNPYPMPDDETERHALLLSLGLLDLPRAEEFERITALCAASLEVPVCLVSLLDTKRQYFLSNRGLEELRQMPRDSAFCNHAIVPVTGKLDAAGHDEPADIFVVADALTDVRFKENVLVTGKPHIRFYAGVPLRVAGDDGILRSLGTLCAIDTAVAHGGLGTFGKRKFGVREKQILMDFGAIAVGVIEQRRAAAKTLALAKSNFISCTAHDIRTPVACFAMALEALRETPLDAEQRDILRDAALSVEVISETVDRAIGASRAANGGGLPAAQRERVDVRAMNGRIDALIRALYSGASRPRGSVADPTSGPPRSKLRFEVAEDVPRYVLTDGALLWRCVMNYVTNALKATNTDDTIVVRFSRDTSPAAVQCCSDDDDNDSSVGDAPGAASPPPPGARSTRGLKAHSPEEPRRRPLRPTAAAEAAASLSPPKRPRVLLRARARGLVALGAQSRPREWLKLEVLDRGGGVPAATLPSLFRAFVQAPQAREGSGLGLAAVKQCAQMLHGACGMRERWPRAHRGDVATCGGCVFWLLVPLDLETANEAAQSDAPAMCDAPAQSDFSAESDALSDAAAEAARLRAALPAPAAGLVALVIEDSLPIRKMLVRQLQKRGFEVDEAGDGEAGLRRLKDRFYDLTIVDFLMPILDGVSCTRRFREWEAAQKTLRLPKFPARLPSLIVGSSANADKKDVEAAMVAGLDHYIQKPLGSGGIDVLLEKFPALRTAVPT